LCIKCGRDNHNSQNCKIPANKLKCDSCNKTGHVSRGCISTLIKKKHDSEVKSIHLNKREAETNVTDYSSLQDLEHIEQVTTIDLFSNTIFNNSEKYFVTVRLSEVRNGFTGCARREFQDSDQQRLNSVVNSNKETFYSSIYIYIYIYICIFTSCSRGARVGECECVCMRSKL